MNKDGVKEGGRDEKSALVREVTQGNEKEMGDGQGFVREKRRKERKMSTHAKGSVSMKERKKKKVRDGKSELWWEVTRSKERRCEIGHAKEEREEGGWEMGMDAEGRVGTAERKMKRWKKIILSGSNARQ